MRIVLRFGYRNRVNRPPIRRSWIYGVSWFRLGRRDFLPGRRAPNLPRGAGEDHVPIGTPSGLAQSCADATQGQQFLLRANIPELDGFPPAIRRKQPASIRREGDA